VAIRPDGVQTRLFVRLPIYLGTWQPVQAYNKEEVVLYNGKYYKLLQGSARITNITPLEDPLWYETSLNIVYLQFPAILANNWNVQPSVNSPVYGFFELRVTEPTDPIFTRTFKPVRGMVEVLFSPTDITEDEPNQTST
jgi:hypothetical protein